VAKTIEQARAYVGRTADLAMCATYFEIGRMIVQEEQGGSVRAEYGKGLLASLSAYLTERVGKGFSETTLKNARKFYQVYSPTIRQTMSAELDPCGKPCNGPDKEHAPPIKSYQFTLGWSHYLILMRVQDPDERRFYEIEATIVNALDNRYRLACFAYASHSAPA